MKLINKINIGVVISTIVFLGIVYIPELFKDYDLIKSHEQLKQQNEVLQVRLAVYLQTIQWYEKETSNSSLNKETWLRKLK